MGSRSTWTASTLDETDAREDGLVIVTIIPRRTVADWHPLPTTSTRPLTDPAREAAELTLWSLPKSPDTGMSPTESPPTSRLSLMEPWLSLSRSPTTSSNTREESSRIPPAVADPTTLLPPWVTHPSLSWSRTPGDPAG